MKRSTGIILALLLLGFGLRVWNLSAQSIWWDEAFTWQTTSHGPANFWQMLLTGDRNPPLYFVSVALWGSVAGWSEFSLRFVSAAWSMVGLAFLFGLTKRLYNIPAGWWALASAAIAPALIVYAQEVRMYAAFFALTAATLYFAWRVFESENRKLYLVFLLCETGLLLTHYFAIPLVVTLNLLALIVLLKRRAKLVSYARWVGGQVLAALPMMLWTLIVFTTPGSLIKAQETPPGVRSFLDQVIMLWLSGVRDLQGEWIALPWLGFLILLMAVIGAWLVNGRSTRWGVAFVVLSIGMAYGMTLPLTSFHPRYALPYSLPLFVMLGAALSNLSTHVVAEGKRKRAARGFAGIATALLLMIAVAAGWGAASAPASAKDDARDVAAYLKQNATADDVILVEANDYTLNYYDHGSAQTKMITATSEPEAVKQLREAVGSAKRVWLPHWAISTQDVRGYWPFLLEQSGRLKSQTSFQGYELAEYEMLSPLREAEMKPTSSDGMITQHSNLVGQGGDGALAFALTWQTPVKFFDRVRASVRLIDARWNTLSARDTLLLDEKGLTTDRWPSLEQVTNYYVLPIPPGTPPGTYTITAQLYHARAVLATETVGAVDVPLRLDMNDPYNTLGGYHWWKPAAGDILQGMTLEAASQSGTRQGMRPFDHLKVVLRWRKTGDTKNLKPRLRLVQGDRVWAESGSDLFERDYPVEQWVVGETVIDRRSLIYPPVRDTLELQVGQDDRWITLAPLSLDTSAVKFDAPAVQHGQPAQFDDWVELIGYDLPVDSIALDRPLDLTLLWRAKNTEPITTPYTVFTQILAPDGHLIAQDDAPPNPPTTHWVPGQIVPDRHSIKVVDPAYRGPATLIVGWYNSATIERVSASSGGDYVTLATPVRVANP